MKHFRRAVGFVLAFAFATISVMYFFHRLGEGDSYSQSTSGGGTRDFGPVVSPATGEVVFSSYQTGRGDLYGLDQNGNNPRRLTRDACCENSPAFSPDGKQIAFIKETPQAWSINVFKGQAWIMNADGSHARSVTHDETDYSFPSFSADGKSLYLIRSTPDFAVCRAELFRVDVEGSHLPVLVPSSGDGKGLLPPSIPERDEWSPNLSPDKTKEVFVFWSHDYQALCVARTDNKGRTAHQVVRLKTDLSRPGFSRNGQWLFFHEGNRFGPIAVSKVGVDGGGYQRIARTSR